MRRIIPALFLLPLMIMGHSANVAANGSINVCHCSGSELSSSNVGLNNQDGEGLYSVSSIERGDCKTKNCTITECFVGVEHYADSSKVKLTDGAFASGTLAFGWAKVSDPDAKYEYALGYGSQCH